MGCGDSIVNVASGGMSGAISSGDPFTGMTSVASGGLLGGKDALLGGDIGKLGTSLGESLFSGGYSNIVAASKYKNFANQMDVLGDPSRVNDRWVRASGELLEEVPLGHEARQLAPMVMSAVGSIYGGPVGGFAGYYLGNKIKGGSNEAGMIGGAMSAGAAGLGAAAAPASSTIATSLVEQGVTPLIANAAAQGVTSAAIGSGMGAAGAAATGRDPGEGAAYGAAGGAISGGISGAMSSQISNLSKTLQDSGMSKTVADSIAKNAIRAASSAGSTYAKQEALGSTYGTTPTATTGVRRGTSGIVTTPTATYTPNVLANTLSARKFLSSDDDTSSGNRLVAANKLASLQDSESGMPSNFLIPSIYKSIF